MAEQLQREEEKNMLEVQAKLEAADAEALKLADADPVLKKLLA